MGKHLQTVAAMACMKTLLILFNFAFGCTGVLMLCVGIWMRIQLKDYVDMSLEGSGAAPLALACLGILVIVASLLACCCTARGHPALLYLYGAFLAVVVLLELGAGASVYACRNTLTERFDQGLNTSLSSYGKDPRKSNDIDTMQSTLHCCGNRAYTDWESITGLEKLPNSCCISEEIPCNSSNLSNVYVQGCYSQVVDFINSNIGLVAGSAVGVAFFPLVGVFLACCLASNINKAKYEQVA